MVMIMRKRVISLVLVLVMIAGICACAKPGANTDDNWFEDSAIINTEFTREKLAQSDTHYVLDYFEASERWAISFVEENYNGYSPFGIAADFMTGQNSVASIFKGVDAVFSTMSYWVQFESESEITGLLKDEAGLYGLHLQVVMRKAEDRVTLLGFVTNQTRQINRPVELAQFLNSVPGYENLQAAEPETEDGITAINLTEKMDGLRVINVIPAGNKLYVLGYDPGYRMAGKSENEVTWADGTLGVFSTESFALLYEYKLTIDFQKMRYFEADGEDLIFSPDTENGSYYRASKTGVTKLDSAPESTEGVYRLSDSAVIRQSDGSLLLEKDGQTTTLFAGIPFEVEKDNMTESVGYTFRYRLSDTAFVYSKYGYEWLIGSRIYDISTGTDTPIALPNAETALYPVAAGNGKVVLVPDFIENATSGGPYIYDVMTGETSTANWLMFYNDRSYPVFKLSGDTLAAFSVDDNGLAIRLCDLNTETVMNLFELHYQAAQPLAVYDTEDAFWFTTDAYSLSDTYLFFISK